MKVFKKFGMVAMILSVLTLTACSFKDYEFLIDMAEDKAQKAEAEKQAAIEAEEMAAIEEAEAQLEEEIINEEEETSEEVNEEVEEPEEEYKTPTSAPSEYEIDEIEDIINHSKGKFPKLITPKDDKVNIRRINLEYTPSSDLSFAEEGDNIMVSLEGRGYNESVLFVAAGEDIDVIYMVEDEPYYGDVDNFIEQSKIEIEAASKYEGVDYKSKYDTVQIGEYTCPRVKVEQYIGNDTLYVDMIMIFANDKEYLITTYSLKKDKGDKMIQGFASIE